MELGQVFTNEYIAKFMVSLLETNKGSRVLEPCFGNGMFLHALKRNNYSKVIGYEIDKELFVQTKEVFSDYDLINADFLNSDLDKVDAIIMNPPYVRHEKIDTLEPLGITKKLLRENSLYRNIPQNANLYVYFIVKALSLLKTNGEMVVIFPSSWTRTKSGVFLQDYFCKQCCVTNQINISGHVFSKKALVDVVILKLKKSFNKSPQKAEKMIFDGTQLITSNSLSLECDLGITVPFRKIASAQRGLSTGCNKLFINPPIDIPTIPIITSPKNVVGYDTRNAKVENLLHISADIKLSKKTKRYLIECERVIIAHQEPKTLYNKICAGDSWYRLELIPSAGIIFGYFIRNEVKFIYNENNLQVRDNFYIIRPVIDTYIAFALLNNLYTYYQLECVGKFYGAGLLKIQRYDLERLKFVDINLLSSNDIKSLRELAIQLIKTGNKEIVAKITRVLSPYTSLDYNSIAKNYANIKAQRLENKHG